MSDVSEKRNAHPRRGKRGGCRWKRVKRGNVSQEYIDELLSKVDIVQLIQLYIRLKSRYDTRSDEWIAQCPFHEERTPSFTVTRRKQFYHCFGCVAHGNAIRFLQEYQRMEFFDAVVFLARQVKFPHPYCWRSDMRKKKGIAQTITMSEVSKPASLTDWSNEDDESFIPF